MKKSHITTILAIFLVIASLGLASAEFWQCFDRGEIVDFCGAGERTCGSTTCYYCMDSYNEALGCFNQGNFNLCNSDAPQCSSNPSSSPQIDSEPPSLEIIGPTQNTIYTERLIPLFIEINEKSNLYYLDNSASRPRWRRICRSCTEYNRNFRFLEGFNDLTFKAEDMVGNTAYQNVSFIIDSKAPRISRTSPRRGLTSGHFTLEFREENPQFLTLHYGNSDQESSHRIDIESECILHRNKYVCETQTDIVDYNNQEISYWFVLTDIAGSTDTSRHTILQVDTTFPILNSIDTIQNGRRTEITLNITEMNFDSVLYKDNSASRPRWRRFCSRLSSGICKKRLSLPSGSHSLDLMVTDKAGNTVNDKIIITI